MHSKNNDGFLLIEAMLAIAIVGLMLMPAFALIQTIFNEVTRLGFAVQRFTQAEQFLYEARRKQPIRATEFTLTKQEEKPRTTLRYILSNPNKKSALGDLDHLYQETVTITPPDKKEAQLISFVFKSEGGA